MKFHRLLSLPFTFIADAVTLGNIGGDRSFTGQVFDAEDREQEFKNQKVLAEAIAEIVRAAKGKVE
jgi:hypothetical protein